MSFEIITSFVSARSGKRFSGGPELFVISAVIPLKEPAR